MKRILLATLAAAALLGAPAAAQVAHVYAGPFIADTALPNSACGPTVAQIAVPYPPPPLPPAAPPLGGHAFNQTTHVVYTTTGFAIQQSAHPLYVPTIPIPAAPFPLPPIVCVPGTIMGPITAMCCSPAPFGPAPMGILFVSDGICIVGLAAAPPYAVVVPPFAPPAAFLAGPITGLEFDYLTASLWVTDITGLSLNITIGGVPLGPPLPTPYIVFGPIIGNVLDRSLPGPGALFTTDGVFLYPIFGAPLIPIPVVGLPPGMGYGASFIAEPVLLRGVCPCGPFTPTIGTTIPIVGSGIPLAITIAGAPPGSTAFLGLDLACGPPLPLGTLCVWWLPIPPLSLLGPVFLPGGAGGLAFGPLPPPPAFIGAVGYAQWAILCTASSSGISLTDALHMRLSAP